MKSRFFFFAVQFLVAFIALRSDESRASVPRGRMENIRIAVLKGQKNLSIENVGRMEIGGRSARFKNSEVIMVSIDRSNALIVDGAKKSGASVKFYPSPSSAEGQLIVNGRRYRGTIEIVRENSWLLAINELPIEIYVAGLINYEISSKWPLEAVKAQAVIARTYALFQKKKRSGGLYHLAGTVADQVYAGSLSEDDAAFNAVNETRGRILMYEGDMALAVYHSNSGGITEPSKNVWGMDHPYLAGVQSPADEDAPNFFWTFGMSRASFETAMKGAGYPVNGIRELIPVYRTDTKRIVRIRVLCDSGAMDMSGEDLRKAVGYDKIRSTLFAVETSGDSFIFSGRGFGHGVGLSQWGAKGMAEKGRTFEEILKHYYPGTTIKRLY